MSGSNVPEHVPHPPFYMDFVDSEDANAMAFTEGDYSFIGITVALIDRIWGICLPEPGGEAMEAAVARARGRHARLLKSAGQAMVGDSQVAMQDLLNRGEG